ncbi:8-oxo-dGTP pyrophosphatase MutT (NUDIX family) [Kitasatospora gansuensis]|uniref:8-oxo-dGTP pyrophosphatase MutT (NUDIX family) n=1 Tax=Kitasatospora gansuensis TaxID=258050 RepID=A0A7W7SD22_9ACTN|nr:NUDIX domain-containing protein [Kitasatospora gansuensis]MBB4948243.1 8-oxo-dGTP pyrophosphatase MutT (NUDIX family) [Kitasatospora gansuensis]
MMPMPPSWPARIRALAEGGLTPPVPKPSATVVLLRDGAGGPEAYLLRRRTSMPFAAGMYAYPGGGVDPRDAEAELGWAGPSPAEWGERLGVDAATAQAVVCAAVRETFEEAGVLLAGPDAGTMADAADWSAERAALEAHELSFADFLRAHGLVLRSDLLSAWARWITPAFEERRYDTWFFVAALPAGQRAADTVGEADRVAWLTPAEAVEGHADGRYGMMPPTVTVLRELLPAGTAAQAADLAADRKIEPVLGTAELAGDRISVRWSGYEELTIDGIFPLN